MIRKDVVTAILATFCITATLFMIVPTNSQYEAYDPWLDSNEDGKIDMLDLYYPALSYGTFGNPTKNVTVTNWPTIIATHSVCVVLNISDQRIDPDGYGFYQGTDFAWEDVTGFGDKTVRFVSGSVSGGGVQSSSSGLVSELPVNGWVEVKDSAGTVLARISLPLTEPVSVSNVSYFTLRIGVTYCLSYPSNSEGILIARQVYASAGVTYEVLG